MIIYNVTIKVEWPIADNWLKWMKEEHMPEMLGTGCFEKHQLVRLLQVDETEGPTYAVQYFSPTLMKYDEYLQNHATGLRQKTIDKWGERVIAFRTLMQMED